MKQEKFLIAGGNSTLLVWDCPAQLRKQIIQNNLGQVEQVGFVDLDREASLYRLTMMGNELCINSTLSLASELSNTGLLLTSATTKPIRYQNIGENTFIELDLPFKKIKNTVILPGIGFICTNTNLEISKSYLSTLATKYALPAFGVIVYRKNKIYPYVYVTKTDSLFQETACGSGSIACALITGLPDIIQPTGEIISVKIQGNKFTIGAKVVKTTVQNKEN